MNNIIESKIKIGKAIRDYRRELGFNQLEFARKLKVSNTTLSEWERGNSLPNVLCFLVLSKILDVDFRQFVDIDEL